MCSATCPDLLGYLFLDYKPDMYTAFPQMVPVAPKPLKDSATDQLD